ncbi:MAG: VacJ family lipoprotein [Betaproteobacteria bacterium]|nr:VacJ family lipoprotein [Betaproteobacteria bacterium]
MNPRIALIITSLTALALSGCASTNAPKADPLEGMNRATFAFNDTVDAAVLKPVAKGYQAITPQFLRSGVNNLFTNVGDVAGAVNSLLQGKPTQAASNAGRFLVNSTLGILGLFDVATPMGLEKYNEDFGQTLGTWGVGTGPYLVIPFMGPSTLRDVSGRGVDSYLGWARQVDHIPTRNSAYGVEIIDVRANLLGAGQALEEAALDKYQFLRDAYLQRRLRAVYDGKAPQEKLDQLEENLEPPRSAAPAKSEPSTKK